MIFSGARRFGLLLARLLTVVCLTLGVFGLGAVGALAVIPQNDNGQGNNNIQGQNTGNPPFPQTHALCASYKGTFGAGGPDLIGVFPAANVIWVCNGVPFVDPATFEAQSMVLQTRCIADGGVQFGLVSELTAGGTHNFTCYNKSAA
jgi:hypothetical protein